MNSNNPQGPQPKKNASLALHKLLNELEITKIKEAFEREDGRKMGSEQLRDTLAKCADIQYDEDKQYETMYKKMNASCNGIVTWDEFISYLILGYEQEQVSVEFKTLDPPIPVAPTLLKSNHRHIVNRITFYPTVRPDRSCTWNDGSIVTCSMDGTINYWSLDMQLERTAQSDCPYLKVQSTWVTDMVVLPDVSVICTSSSERDLRFYDTSARKFELRVMIISFPNAITTMYYTFEKDLTIPSKLICGDTAGNVKIIFIESEARGPFKSQPGIPLREARYDQLMKGAIPHMKLTEINNLHTDFVRQVYFYSTLHSVVSCAKCYKGVQITDITDTTKFYTFKILGGVWSFAVSEETHLVATGGPDCLVRVWNPFVQGRPICTFYGHHTGIVKMIFQDNGEKLYSLSKDKCIKVWDVGLQDLLQTYLELPSQLGEKTDLTALYNPESRQWIIGSIMIAILPLSPKQSSEHTDGSTHTSGVSVVLYNKLFQCIVSCGLDSFIIVWDPWDGRRLLVIKDAHTVMLHGEILPVEITAATFDPGQQRLLTGAHDGTLKVWNFNTGTCLRNLKIEPWCEVQSVIWVKGRIMAIGWNRRVTEFADTNEDGPGGAFCKNWDLRHSDDISSAVVRIPETVATSSYVGELILWRLETGQPYKKFNVQNPTARIKLFYHAAKSKEKPPDEKSFLKLQTARKTSSGSDKGLTNLSYMGDSISGKNWALVVHTSHKAKFNLWFGDVVECRTQQSEANRQLESIQACLNVVLSWVLFNLPPLHLYIFSNLRRTGPMKRPGPRIPKSRRVSTVAMPDELISMKKLAVHTTLFLNARKSDPGVGTLLVSLENGIVQVWSHMAAGGFITSFSAIHKAGDYVISMATDEKNEYLFTGTTVGYLKTWLLKNYCVLEEDKEHICMPQYRLKFPFMWGDRFVGRARRMTRDQPFPILLNSFKGHFMPISGIIYIDQSELIISCSADYSCRVWTLGGRYLQTLGTFKKWKPLNPNGPVDPNKTHFDIPPDIKRVASSTTLRVLSGGSFAKRLTIKQLKKLQEKDMVHVDATKIYGKALNEPVLGHYYTIPERTTKCRDVEFDTSFSYIPVYQHLITPTPLPIERKRHEFTPED